MASCSRVRDGTQGLQDTGRAQAVAEVRALHWPGLLLGDCTGELSLRAERDVLPSSCETLGPA